MNELNFNEQLEALAVSLKSELSEVAGRIRQHAKVMPAAAFTAHPQWAAARWSATTFRWHPTSEVSPVMGLVFENTEAGLDIFREAKRTMNQQDRFEEIRLSIIEGKVPGQEQRPGYSVHLSPDPDALAMHATGSDFVVDASVLPFLGQWNRHYPVAGQPNLLQRFKQEFAKHGEYMLAPVVRKADGQLWAEPTLGIIKNEIHFRTLADITSPDDPDAAATMLPQLITPPT